MIVAYSSGRFFQFRLKQNSDVIDPGGPLVRCNLRECSSQSPFGVNLVNQAELLASFDPLFEGCQHPLCPNRRFDLEPQVQGLSGTYSPCGHCHRSFFHRFGHRVSTFLHPFAPPALSGFFATMGALTPGRRLFGSSSMNTCFGAAQISLRFVIESSDHSVSNHPPSSRHDSGVFYAGLTVPRCRDRPFPGSMRSWASPLPSRLATTVGRIEFTCVTD